MPQPSEFKTMNSALVTTECTTLKMGACPEHSSSIKWSNKRMRRDHGSKYKLWMMAHAKYIRHLVEEARPQHKIRCRRRTIEMARCYTHSTQSQRIIKMMKQARIDVWKRKQQLRRQKAAAAKYRQEEDEDEVSDNDQLRMDVDLFAPSQQPMYTALKWEEQTSIFSNVVGKGDEDNIDVLERDLRFWQHFGKDYQPLFLKYFASPFSSKALVGVDLVDAIWHTAFILRHEDLRLQLQVFCQDIHNLKDLLGRSEEYTDTVFSKQLKQVLHVLKRKLNNLWTDNCQGKLASCLYEILPATAEQQKLIPQINVDLGDGIIFKFFTVIRKKGSQQESQQEEPSMSDRHQTRGVAILGGKQSFDRHQEEF